MRQPLPRRHDGHLLPHWPAPSLRPLRRLHHHYQPCPAVQPHHRRPRLQLHDHRGAPRRHTHRRLAHATLVTINGGTGGGSKAVPQITWPTPASIPYGTALAAAQLNATSNALGSFAYSQASGAVLPAGTQTLSVTFTPLDTSVYTSATASVSLTVSKASPTITWPPPPSLLHTDALSATQLNASASCPGTFSYTPAAGATLPLGTATLSATFIPTDASNYNTVTVTRSLAVTATPTASDPAFVQGVSAPAPPTSTTPIVFTLPTAPAVGNLLTAIIIFNPGQFEHDWLAPDNTWNVTLGGRTGPGSGSAYRVVIATHIVTPLDGSSFTFIPTTGADDGHTTFYLFETAHTSTAQIAFSLDPAQPFNTTQTTASLVPAAAGSLVLSGVYPVYSGPTPSGCTEVPNSPVQGFLVQSTALTVDASTPISTSFANYAPVPGVGYILILAPGNPTPPPIASPMPGAYDATLTTPRSVTLSSSTSGAVIRYTLDGSLPTSSSAVYSAPLSLDRTTQLNAVALAPGFTPSGVVPYNFVVGAGTLLGVGLNGDWHGYLPFPNDLVHQPVDTALLEPTSTNILALMATAGTHLGPDAGIRINVVDSTPGFPYTTPVQQPISANLSPLDTGGDLGIDRCLWPIPSNVFIESDPPPSMSTSDNHAMIIDRGGKAFYEAWRLTYGPTSASRPTYYASSNATIFDLTLPDTMQHNYSQTTADAGGLSIIELMPRYDEIMAAIRDGSMCLKHAVRMDSKRFGAASVGSSGYGYFQPPALHSSANGRQNLTDADLIWYGMQIRLQAGFDVSSYSPVNQVMLNTFKKYGFILADISDTSFTFNFADDPRFDHADILKLSQVPYTALEVVKRTTILNGASYPRDPSLVAVIQSFTASATSVAAGTPVTLSATFTNGSFAIVPQAGLLRSGGSVVVHPTATTTYQLIVNSLNLVGDDGTGDGTRATASLTVTVA